MKKTEIYSTNIREIFPKKLFITTSNGNYELKIGDLQKTFPSIQVVYNHSTPSLTDNVLSDGEPDSLGLDIHFLEKGELFFINCDITYGDAMMFSFKMTPENKVKVGHYNGYGSKFDPNYEFYFQEESISQLIELFNKLNDQLKLDRTHFNFLDGDKSSFKMEKVRYISDFKNFIPL